jgi:hypothetical protein
MNALVVQTRTKPNPLAVNTLCLDWLVQVHHPSNMPEWKGVEILVVWTYVATEKEEPSNADVEAAIRGEYGL